MTRPAQRGAPPRAPAPPPPAATLADEATQEMLRPLETASAQAFEQMLLAKWNAAELSVRRVPMPPQIKQVAYIWIREQNSEDEVTAATWADQLAKPAQRKLPRLLTQLEQRESKRLAICAIWRRGSPAPEETNVNAALPLLEIDKWSTKFWAILELHYMDFNGIPNDEVLKSLAEAVTLGAPLPPKPPTATGPGREEEDPADAE